MKHPRVINVIKTLCNIWFDTSPINKYQSWKPAWITIIIKIIIIIIVVFILI